MALWAKLKFWSSRKEQPIHLERGSLGEDAARDYLKGQGLKFLTANFSCKEGEIDLIFRDGETLVFVEVKTRTAGGRTRPGKAVDNRKRRALIRTANEYLRLLKNPAVAYRYDVVEVLLVNGTVTEVRHNANSFTSRMLKRWRR
ncbi:MAG: YraN family protein [Limisphaerales bacterium]